jgi:serine protease AprX
MKKLWVVLLLIFAVRSEAQFNRYIIQFKNKAFSPYTFAGPSAYLSQRAIDRRTRYQIPIDSTDLPVTPRYLDSIRSAGAVVILNVSRWLNQVSIQTADAAALQKIRSFPFVENATAIATRRAEGGRSGTQEKPELQQTRSKETFNPTADFYNYGASYQQVHLHNGEFLHNIGLRGQEMVIGLLDGGFFNYTTLRSFDSVNRNGQVLGTWDFVARESSVTEDNQHGMQCFSVIAANIPSQFVGTAPKAAFYLYRTEEGASEFPIEEHMWVCAAERLDSAGGDVISSSLGYSDGMTDPRFDHGYNDMDGNTTIAARGADLAAKKGILVVNAAGNQGDEPFRFLATPADADSVLAVGAVNSSGQPAAFSSYGPSADGQVKPDVASLGVATALQTAANTIGASNGTSFACPNIAGLATCLWQGFREFNNIKIIDALRRSGSKAAAPDNRVGYGIPDVKKAVLLLLNDFSNASVTATTCKNTINWRSKDMVGMKYELERKAAGETTFTKIGEMPAKGTVFSTQQYQFGDSLITIQAGLISYRIRQIIDTATSATGSADYIDTVTVNLAATCTTTPVTAVPLTEEEFTVIPNPAQNKVSLRITTPSAIPSLTFRIVDSRGSVVAVRKETKGAGTVSYTFPVSHLASGTYYILVYKNENRLAVKEFMKL